MSIVKEVFQKLTYLTAQMPIEDFVWFQKFTVSWEKYNRYFYLEYRNVEEKIPKWLEKGIIKGVW